MLLDNVDEGGRSDHALPLHHPVPLVQTLAERVDHLQQKRLG